MSESCASDDELFSDAPDAPFDGHAASVMLPADELDADDADDLVSSSTSSSRPLPRCRWLVMLAALSLSMSLLTLSCWFHPQCLPSTRFAHSRLLNRASLLSSGDFDRCFVKPPRDQTDAWQRTPPPPVHDRQMPLSDDEKVQRQAEHRGATEGIFYQQAHPNGRSMLLTCPPPASASSLRPRIRIVSASHGSGVCGFHPESGLPALPPIRDLDLADDAPLPRDSPHQPCAMDFTAVLSARCDGQRLCCINEAQVMTAEAKPCDPGRRWLTLVSWRCDVDDAEAEAAASADSSWLMRAGVALHLLTTLTSMDSGLAWRKDLATVESIDSMMSSEQQEARNRHGAGWLIADAAKGLPPSVPSAAVVAPLVSRRCTLQVHLEDNISHNGAGLFNQLLGLCTALSMAQRAHCNVSVESFLPSYNEMLRVRFGDVVDIDASNSRMQLEPTLHQPELGLPAPSLSDAGDPMHYRPWSTLPLTHRSAALDDWALSVSGGHESNFTAYSKQVSAHPNPGTLTLGNTWPAWVPTPIGDRPWPMACSAENKRRQHAALGALVFAPRFHAAVAALHAVLGMHAGSYVTVHYRMEDDLRAFSHIMGTKLDVFLDQQWERVHNAFQQVVDQELKADKEAEEQWRQQHAQTGGSDPAPSAFPFPLLSRRPVYLATGVQSAHRYVRRLRLAYPDRHFFTKDQAIRPQCVDQYAAYMQQQRPDKEANISASESEREKEAELVAPPLERAHLPAFIRALSALPWHSLSSASSSPFPDVCGWLSGSLGQPPNRELWAILDFLMVLDAQQFVGWGGSTFSLSLQGILTEVHRTFQLSDTALPHKQTSIQRSKHVVMY